MKGIPGVFLVFFLTAHAAYSQPAVVSAESADQAPAAYDRVVIPVVLRNADPARIEKVLKLLAGKWGIFSSLQYLTIPVPGGEKEMLFLRGRGDEVEAVRRIAETLDGLYPAPETIELVPLPLVHLNPSSMREKLLALSARSAPDIQPDQLIIFPDTAGGSLFFRGSSSTVKQVRDAKAELDQPRHESFPDLATGFLRTFRQDVSSHFLTISTYVASALILLLLHFILVHIPWLGKQYQRWFTLIWTRLIDDIKGRDFALEVIKSLAETAVESAEQTSRTAMKSGDVSAPVRTAERKKDRALAIVRDLLIYRGFNPDDPQVKRIVNDMIEAKLFTLREKEASPDRGGE